MTADSKFVTGPNLADLAERKTTFYGPIDKQPEFVKRADGSVPIPAEKWSELPTTVVRKATKGQPAQVQLTKAACLYDCAAKSYWCPTGKPLKYVGKTSELRPGTARRLERERYESDPVQCAACLLRGQKKVSAEWNWMTTAANLQVMIRLWRQYIEETGSAFVKPARAKGARASPMLVGP